MARYEVIEADNLVILLEEYFDEIGSDESSPAGDQNSRVFDFGFHSEISV